MLVSLGYGTSQLSRWSAPQESFRNGSQIGGTEMPPFLLPSTWPERLLYTLHCMGLSCRNSAPHRRELPSSWRCPMLWQQLADETHCHAAAKHAKHRDDRSGAQGGHAAEPVAAGAAAAKAGPEEKQGSADEPSQRAATALGSRTCECGAAAKEL
mmetsp:Transcript_40513/g.114757  ORF Transcript_40513/g.114757 Transcript_40513/m.114757 type:complete len:155 (+) Transcript_40513:241-705(+)